MAVEVRIEIVGKAVVAASSMSRCVKGDYVVVCNKVVVER